MCVVVQAIAEARSEGTPADRFLDMSGQEEEANQVTGAFSLIPAHLRQFLCVSLAAEP